MHLWELFIRNTKEIKYALKGIGLIIPKWQKRDQKKKKKDAQINAETLKGNGPSLKCF